eukprot:TRINITY_DN68248_c0_g1_i1.p1 TRINITY_DN68248_c0_g1~~TRINITY_DN68248_c0_g1_i1.p1  ORF type:complete len:228 (-),score=56.10 TRINITY_DN68248_c0_g1_i1:429-1112(-)
MAFRQCFESCPRQLNILSDSEAQARIESFKFVVEDLLTHPHHIEATGSHIRKLLRAAKDQRADVASECFDVHVHELKRLPEAFRTKVVITFTKLDSEELVKCLKFDSDVRIDLLEFLMQTPRNFRLVGHVRTRMVYSLVLDARIQCVGARSAAIEKEIDDASGRLKWEEFVCYKLGFNERRACSILHCSGDKVDVPAHVAIDADFVLSSNYSDWAASVQKPSLDAIR